VHSRFPGRRAARLVTNDIDFRARPASVEEADFTWLRDKTGSTDGNLGAQLMKLEEAGYVAMQKRFAGRKPQTLYRMTPAGRKALAKYVAALKRLLGGAL